MTFTKYMHVERLTNDNPEIDGILNGKVYVYPKLDGSNHCIWYDEGRGEVRCASRNQVLTEDYDSTKFFHTYYMKNKHMLDWMASDNKNLVFYGEFMQPHVIKNYLEEVWGKWFIFDVYDTDKHRWLSYDEYVPILAQYNMYWIPPLGCYVNPTNMNLQHCIDTNDFMMTGNTLGEGIVIKNYDFKNIYGRTTWAKIVRDEFKTLYRTPAKDRGEDISYESKLVDQYLNPDFIEKEYYKLVDERGGWNDAMIPDLIKQVMFEWWKDYSYDVIASSKKPIDVGNFRKHMSKNIVRVIKKIRK